MRPLIGITCNLSDKVIAGINPSKYQDLNTTYTKAVQDAGGIPVMIPNGLKEEELIELEQRLDGFLFSGGVDVDPLHYGMEADETLGTVTPERDETELILLRFLLDHSDKPILGICRGIQIINVAMGGTLIMDLPTAGKDNHFLTDQPRKKFTHEIVIENDTRLSSVMKKENRVNSFHHQAVGRLAEGLKITARSAKDQVIEAVESANEKWILAVQWHPEELTFNPAHRRLFEELVRQAQWQRKHS